MKKKSNSQSAFLNLRVFIGLFIALAGVFLALLGAGAFSSAIAQSPSENPGGQSDNLAQIFRPHLWPSDDAERLTQPLPPLKAPLLPTMQLSTVAWTAIGPAPLNSSQATGNVSGRITAIAAHPTDANTIKWRRPEGPSEPRSTMGLANNFITIQHSGGNT
jgi:hypothetical protein